MKRFLSIFAISFIILLQSFGQVTQGTRITAPIVPNDSADVYPTHDEYFGRGGYRTVSTTTARDAIQPAYRKEGMLVKVLADSKIYTLSGGIENTNWIVLQMGETLTASSPLVKTGTVLSIPAAASGVPGYMTASQVTVLTNKQNGLQVSGPLVLGANVNQGGYYTQTLTIPQATSTTSGYLTVANWTTFNNKESPLTFTSPLSRSSNIISIPTASTSVDGYITSNDWNTFNKKLSLYDNNLNVSGILGFYSNNTRLAPPVRYNGNIGLNGSLSIYSDNYVGLNIDCNNTAANFKSNSTSALSVASVSADGSPAFQAYQNGEDGSPVMSLTHHSTTGDIAQFNNENGLVGTIEHNGSINIISPAKYKIDGVPIGGGVTPTSNILSWNSTSNYYEPYTTASTGLLSKNGDTLVYSGYLKAYGIFGTSSNGAGINGISLNSYGGKFSSTNSVSLKVSTSNSANNANLAEFSNTGTAFGVYIANTNTGAGLRIDNSTTGKGSSIYNTAAGQGSFIYNSSYGDGLAISNVSTGTGINLYNSGSSYGIRIDNTKNGVGLFSDNYSNGYAAHFGNSGTGSAILVTNGGTGDGLIISNNYTGYGIRMTTGNTGIPFILTNGTTTPATFKIDNACNVNTTGVYQQNGTSGLTATKTFTDAGGKVNTITIQGGIITAWTQL